VDVAGERGEEVDVGHVRLVVEHGLVEVRDRPPQRDVDPEELRQHGGRSVGVGVAPGAERCEQLALFVEREVAVHHRRDADGADRLQPDVVPIAHVGDEVGVCGLQAGPHIVDVVGPQPVDEAVLPGVAADGDHRRRIVGEHEAGLDARRAELDAERGAAVEDRLCRLRRHDCSSASRRSSPDCPYTFW
jgi:hypothetical protein